MHDPQEIERIMARLMPSAMSDSGKTAIEGLIDELAVNSGVRSAPKHQKRLPYIAAGIAATFIVSIAFLRTPLVPQSTASLETPHGIRLLGESDRVESMIDEGWHEISDGTAMRAMRLNVVEENRLFDEETGIVMQVTEPREEWLIMPVSAF